jgi:hypothetical protein
VAGKGRFDYSGSAGDDGTRSQWSVKRKAEGSRMAYKDSRSVREQEGDWLFYQFNEEIPRILRRRAPLGGFEVLSTRQLGTPQQ